DALKTILRNTNSEGGQRAHVLHAAYGSGKSHFAVALAGLLENTKERLNILHAFAQRLGEVDATTGELAHEYINEGKRLFPVVLSGNEGNFAHAMLRALTRSLDDSHIDVQLSTRFDVAINTIERWEVHYPDFYQRLQQELKSFNKQSVSNILKALQTHDDTAYDVFVNLYAKMTAGAVFDPLVE